VNYWILILLWVLINMQPLVEKFCVSKSLFCDTGQYLHLWLCIWRVFYNKGQRTISK
jgi:hypothetical protein